MDMSGMSDDVTIYGCGMSGLVAAINLARQGIHVTVHDREPGYGGSRLFNPSTHATPLDPQKTSDYIGIDITSAFHPVIDSPAYFHETKVMLPIENMYAVERGNRSTSLDTLLWEQCQWLGIDFIFESDLSKVNLDKFFPRTILACGLNAPAYEMLGIPCSKWQGWMSRGELDIGNMCWMWLDECITEYGYFSAVNGYYFDLLFSVDPVGPEALKKYRTFMSRHEGLEHREWQPISGVAPIGAPDNPRLFWKGAILCGTIAGTMDPLLGFGISGALVSGKVAALAITDPDAAQVEFNRFTRHYRSAFYMRDRLWLRHIRPRVGAMERAINLVGVKRVEWLGRLAGSGRLPIKGAIPGFGPVNCS
jgi:hypothetical protein